VVVKTESPCFSRTDISTAIVLAKKGTERGQLCPGIPVNLLKPCVQGCPHSVRFMDPRALTLI